MSSNSDLPRSKSANRDAYQLNKIAQLLGVSVDQLHNPDDPVGHVTQTRKLFAGWFSLKDAEDRVDLLRQLENIIARKNLNNGN